jgi:glycosyltransferase involved in cell wall biosynthesis
MRSSDVVLLDARLWSGSGLSRVTREMVPRLAKELRGQGRHVRLLTAKNHVADVDEYGDVEVVHGSIHDVRLGADMYRLGRRYPEATFYSPHYRAFPSFPGRQFVTVCDLIYLRCGYPLNYRAYVRAYLRRLKLARVTAICISNATLAELREDYPGVRAEVVHCGVRRPVAQALPTREGRKGVLYVGDSSRHKNLPTLVEGVRIARSHGSDLTLTVAGSRSDRAGLPDFVDLRIRPTDGELAELYSTAVAIVHPSLMEGFSLVPFEAASYGTPVVVSRIAAHSEMLGDAVEMFAPHDSQALADALVRLETDGEWWRTCQRRAFDHALNNGFSWDGAAIRVADLMMAR